MTQKRRKYTDDFKGEAVNLLISSGKSLAEIASDLGIPLYNLSRWKNKFMGIKNNYGNETENPVERIRRLESDNQRLTKEITTLKQERDILKKAMGIVSKQ